MKIGIVGSEGAKFTPLGEERAKEWINKLLTGDYRMNPGNPPKYWGPETTVVSGHCHLGGIDIWAEEIADSLGFSKLIFPPKTLRWEGGYKQRNLEIAKNSDMVYCISVKDFPETYTGMRFPFCYHCKDTEPAHIKSGGCWTTKEARKMGKSTKLIIVENV